jgi:hypothetical protein
MDEPEPERDMDADYGMPSYPASGRPEQPMRQSSSTGGWVAVVGVLALAVVLGAGVLLALLIWLGQALAG